MKLATTMGVELTYVPAALQILADEGITLPDNYGGPQHDLTSGFVGLMRRIVEHKNIPTYRGVLSDPGVVEIPTKPYQKLSELMTVIRSLNKEAENIGLLPGAQFQSGGGAHIHTGTVGKTPEARYDYARRAIIFASMNPWLAWATAGTGDDINSQPIPRHMLRNVASLREVQNDIANYEQEISIYKTRIAGFEKQAHEAKDEYVRTHYNRYRESDVRRIKGFRKMIIELRKTEAKLLTENATPVVLIDQLNIGTGKGYMFNYTGHTVEMRCFDMGDASYLKKNILLANAIVKYVSKQDYTEINLDWLPTGEQIRNMTWRQARMGFVGMLHTLGLNPDDWREYVAQIAIRWRMAKINGMKPNSCALAPTDVGPTRAQEIAATAERFANRARNRAIARHDRNVARRERIAARLAYREALAAGLITQASTVMPEPAGEVDEAAAIEAESIAESVEDDETMGMDAVCDCVACTEARRIEAETVDPIVQEVYGSELTALAALRQAREPVVSFIGT